MSTLIHFVRDKNIRDKFFCTADPKVISKIIVNDELPITPGTHLKIHKKDYIVQKQIFENYEAGSINERESHYYGKSANYKNEVYYHVELKTV